MVERRKLPWGLLLSLFVLLMVTAYYLSGLAKLEGVTLENWQNQFVYILLHPLQNWWNDLTFTFLGIALIVWIGIVSKGNVLEYDTTSLIYSTTVYQKISNSISREKLERCSSDEDLSFAPKEVAQEEINTILEDMKIPTENLVYSCYVVSPNAIEQKDIVSSSREGKDGYYFFSIRQIIDEKPVIFQFFDTYISLAPSTAPIQILYSSGGIEYMSISDLYDIDTELNSEKLIPFSSINEKILYKYSQLINSSSYKVNDTEFGYFILNCGKRKELVPVWVIFIKESTKEKEYEYQELYNALTGEEIVL